MPTTQSITQNLAKHLEAGISEAHIATTQKALKSLFNFLHEEGLWQTNSTAKMKIARGGV